MINFSLKFSFRLRKVEEYKVIHYYIDIYLQLYSDLADDVYVNSLAKSAK